MASDDITYLRPHAQRRDDITYLRPRATRRTNLRQAVRRRLRNIHAERASERPKWRPLNFNVAAGQAEPSRKPHD